MRLKVKEFREQKGMQQKALAITVGISQSKLSKIESGKTKLDTGVLEKICRYFNVPLEYFYNNPVKTISQSILYKPAENNNNYLLSRISEMEKYIKRLENLIAKYESMITQQNEKIVRRDKKIEKLKVMLN